MTGRTLRYSSVKISLLLLTIFTIINIYIHQKNVHINFEKETAENSQNELKRMMGRIRNGKIHFSINFTHPRPYKKLKIRKEINIAEEIVEEVGRDDKFEKCPQRVERTTVNITKYNWLQSGGHYVPPCLPKQTLALIIPFRNRPEQLEIFLAHIHPFLKSQHLNYTIFVTEQTQDSLPFNKGQIMNTAYLEALKIHNFTCFIFHDVDLLPENNENFYGCTKGARHLVNSIDKWNYSEISGDLFGGVVAVHRDVFRRVNGYSNRFWGWGGEDDDFKQRMDYWRVGVTRSGRGLGRYKMLKHESEIKNLYRYDLLERGFEYFEEDGLKNLKTRVESVEVWGLFIRILVQVGPN